ncbi:hypothetical protein ACPV3A_14535 [Paenibacillus sp. Dod16]|uniref:hypothetical protein n=1 Tax=Paenibacillus sp. Dod16 TaxID=3416392 RepID=UPI003CE9A3E4
MKRIDKMSMEIAKLVFRALVNECSKSIYKSTSQFKWQMSVAILASEDGLWISQEKFDDAYRYLMDAGFVERRNVKHKTKYGRGFFTFKPTRRGIDQMMGQQAI